MIRITRILENNETILLKLEGDLGKMEEIDWPEIWEELNVNKEKTLVIDFCESSLFNPMAVEGIRQIVNKDTILLNCSESLALKLRDV